MKSRRLVAGNWKMNLNRQEAQALVSEIAGMLQDETMDDFPVVIFPPFPYLILLANQVRDAARIRFGAQNCSAEQSGAFTGEVSAAMLSSCGVNYVLAGHSERRALFGETDAIVAKKVQRILEEGMTPVFCCGETLDQRNGNLHFDAVKRQVETVIATLSNDHFKKLVIAYEPVWAIGSGLTATASQAAEMHTFIRSILTERQGEAADRIPLLYGGSCNENNAKELFAAANVDGGLIGGASLKSRSFVSIVKSFS